ncbi:MAG: pentapeptide repeat-containing protein, partial [Cyanobacteria bacterium P01_F01_bin.3]
MRGAKFVKSQMANTHFHGADIRGATFAEADLKQADFTQTNTGIRPVLKVIFISVLVLLAAISGVAHGHASGITFSDTPLVSSLSYAAYQHYFLIPRSVMLSALAIFATIAIWNGIGNGLAAIALTVTGIFLTATIVALGFFRDTLWSVVDYSLWGVAGSMAWATFGTVTLAINATMLSILGSAKLIPLAVLASDLGTVGLSIIEPDFLTSWQHPTAWGVAFFFNGLGGYLAWRAYQAQQHFRWMQLLAVFLITTVDNTDFSQADLSEADFTAASLGQVKFANQVQLKQTCFYQAKKLEQARLYGTYLSNPIIRRLLVEKQVKRDQFCQFDGLNLQGVNLRGAILVEGSFVGTDFSETDLQDADLSRANLTRVQLDTALLKGAILTGAIIEGWSITHRTHLQNVACEYVFMKWVKAGDTDQNPLRKPDSYRENFKPGEFVDFIQPLFTTLDLYHTQDVDPRAIAISYQHLEENYPEAQLDIVALEKRGKQKEQVLLRVEATQDSDLSELSETYLETYNQLRQLPKNSLLLLVAEQNFQINLLTQRIQSMLGQAKKTAISSNNPSKRGRHLVVFTFTQGNLHQGFSMSVLIWPYQSQLPEIVTSNLPPAAAVNEAYQNWSQLYRAIYSDGSRISFSSENDEIRNISLIELENRAFQLIQTFNHWLRSEAFLKIS